eukprot:Platyproteum_vivax@DN14151_c0_g1_i1.p1
MKCILVIVLLPVVLAQLNSPQHVVCESNYMEVCFDDLANDYLWADGNNGGVLSQSKIQACSSFEKVWNNQTMSCGITAYFEKNADLPIRVDGLDRYNCNNDVSEADGLLRVQNKLAQKQGGVSIGSQVKYSGTCTYNLRFEDVETTLEIPEIDTKFSTDHGDFNADLKMCTSRNCQDFFALPASSTALGDEYVMQVSTVGASLYPRLRNCWASPAAPVNPKNGGTPHSAQIQIVQDYCKVQGSPIESEMMVWDKDGVDDVRLVVPSFSFVGAHDSDGNYLKFTFVMCEVAIGLTPSLGVGEHCHKNGHDTSTRRLTRNRTLAKSWEERVLQGDEVTATVGGAFLVDTASVSVKAPEDTASTLSLLGAFMVLLCH